MTPAAQKPVGTPEDSEAIEGDGAAAAGARSGQLCVVATPIGNLADLSPRARAALLDADLILCEDTRHTGRLLATLDRERPPLLSLHEHNERERTGALIERLRSGEDLALVCDAGTPLVSDPGFVLVREAIAANVSVTAVPGPSAVLCALVVSGLAPQPFTFAGFPPPKRGKRTNFLQQFAALEHTLVLYESPHRLLATLQDAAAVFGEERRAVVARELSKLHEEVLRAPLRELAQQLATRAKIKGEIVLLIDGRGR